MRRLLAAARRFLFEVLTAEGRALFAAFFIIGGLGLDVDRNRIHQLWALLAGLLVAALAARRFARVDARIEARGPRRVRIGEEASFLVEVGDTPLALELRGPPLPAGATWTTPRASAVGRGHHTMRARFERRGEHDLGGFTARAIAPLGFSFGPPIASPATKLLVVPWIAPIHALRLPQTQRYQPGGVALASKTGESMELLGIRDYRPGDPVRDLHARTWARTGRPVVREYQQEYFSRVGVVLDTDGTVANEAGLEAAISVAAGVVAHLSRSEVLIDLLVVGDRVHPLTVGRSLGFLDQALDLLACVRPGPKLGTDALLRRLAPFLGRLSSVVIVALADDADRRALAHGVRARGVACFSVVLGDRQARTPEVAHVPIAAVERREALSL